MKKHWKIFAALLLSSTFVLSVSGCSQTVRPQPEPDRHASFDGGHDDSGLIQISGGVALVTSRFVERYNAMIEVYGSEPEFLPPLVKDYGVTPASGKDMADHPGRGTLYLMTNEALVKFIKMNQWRKMGRVPASQQKKPGVVPRVIDAIIS